MIHKLLITSSDRTINKWRTMPVKIEKILYALNKTKNAVWQVEYRYQPFVPEVKNGRITHDWYNKFSYPLFRQGYQHHFLHMSEKQWDLWELQSNLRGANQIDRDFVNESYGWADEDTKRGIYDQFVQIVLHETWHELCRACGVKDTLHEWHTKDFDITKADWSVFDMNKWQPVYQEGMKKVGLLQQVLELTKRLNFLKKKTPKLTLVCPIPKKYQKITQPYGVFRPEWYPQTKHHIGADFATPVGTPLVAPFHGEIVKVGYTPILGFYCHYAYTFDGVPYMERYIHLREQPKLGKRKQGEVVAYSGKTGFIRGVHTHIDIWFKEVNVPILTEKNFRNYTIDPAKHYSLESTL